MKPTFTEKKLQAFRGDTSWKAGTEDANITSNADDVLRWIKCIQRAEKDSESWKDECKDAWREYQAQNDRGEYRKLTKLTTNSYSRYWSDTMIMLPAIYGECPRIISRTRFEKDDVSRTAGILAERMAAYIIDQSSFHRSMSKAALEFLHCSRATGRAFFEAEFITRKKRVPLQEVETEAETQSDNGEALSADNGPTTILVDEDYNTPPEETVILTDESGQPYYELEEQEEEATNHKFWFRPLHFDEIVHSSGARNFDEVWWIAFKCTVTRKRASELFGSKVKEIIDARVEDDEITIKEKNLDLFQYWELWNKRDKKVYYIHELYKSDFLKQIEDPYGLPDFYPCPRFMLANERYDDLFPVPDYTQTRDQYEQLRLLARRINRLTKAIKGSLLFDSSVEGIQQMFKELADGEGYGVSNFGDLTSKGGLDNCIQIPAYERLAQTLQVLIQVFEKISADIDQLRGIADIVRGSSDPAVSATAERIKKAAANSRFSQRQKEMMRFVRDSIEILVDIAFATMEDEQVKEVVGYAYLESDDQARFEQALVLARDSKSRLVRVDIETDSLIALDEQDDQESTIKLLDSFSKFIPATLEAVRSHPEMAEVSFKLLEQGLTKFRYGKNAADAMKRTFEKVYANINQPQPPPPPDPKLLSIQSDERIAQMELQVKMQLQAATNQIAQMKLQMENYLEQQKLVLAQRAQLWTEQVDSQKLHESFTETQMIVDERLQTEDRLNRELALDEFRLQVDASKPPEVQMPAPAPVTINVQGGQPGQPVPIAVPSEPQIIPVPTTPLLEEFTK